MRTELVSREHQQPVQPGLQNMDEVYHSVAFLVRMQVTCSSCMELEEPGSREGKLTTT